MELNVTDYMILIKQLNAIRYFKKLGVAGHVYFMIY